MFQRSVSADDLARLKREREEADRAYNEALTRLDRSLPARPATPSPAAGGDDGLDALRAGRRLTPDWAAAPVSGWRARLRAAAWRAAAPIVQRQERFNALLIEHLERGGAAEAARRQAADAAFRALDGHLEETRTFHSRLVQYLQQITPFVDTKDREMAGLARRITEDAAAHADDIDRRLRALGDLGTTVAHLQHEVTALRGAGAPRPAAASAGTDPPPAPGDLSAAAGDPPAAPGDPPAAPEDPPAAPEDPPAADPGRQGIDSAVDAYSYVGFEDRYRGAWEAIRERQSDYAPLFAGASDVLDVGCGRGEFLDLLREAGVAARGVDANPEMVAACRARGLAASAGDALEAVEALPDGALGGLFSAQVVEHLPADRLVRLVRAAWRKLRPGSRIVIETINPACWLAFFETYLRDFTHVQPLHPETLSYLLAASGFHAPEIRYRSPLPEAHRLRRLDVPDAAVDARLAACLRTVNHNVDRLNGLLFSSMDYAAVAERR